MGEPDRDLSTDNIHRGSFPVQQKSYELTGKIMLSAIVILFAVVVFMVCLHLYARWYLLRARRRQLTRRSRRRTQLVFYVDPNAAAAPIGGLDASVLESLPVFVYSSKTHPEEVLECAVCLSEFEENEKGRLLPKCNHRFHTECIDMWFHSHSTCPICRSLVEPQILAPVIENRSDVVISVGEPVDSEPGSSSGMCSACLHDDEVVSMASPSTSSSVGARRKGLDLVRVTIEVPRRNDSENELRTSSPASQGFRSPGTRLLSLKRILSMNKRSTSSAVSPSSGVGTSCGAQPTELDIERGRDESTQARTPR